MINERQTTTINLTLTEDEFDDLYEVVEETIYNIKDNLENTGWELNDYEIYKVFQQMNRFRDRN